MAGHPIVFVMSNIITANIATRTHHLNPLPVVSDIITGDMRVALRQQDPSSWAMPDGIFNHQSLV